LFIKSFNMCLFFRKSRVNGSVWNITETDSMFHTILGAEFKLQMPIIRRNQIQRCICFPPLPLQEFYSNINIIILNFPPFLTMFTSIFLHLKLYWSNYVDIEKTNQWWCNVLTFRYQGWWQAREQPNLTDFLCLIWICRLYIV
jgi:hypothetical protein